MSGVVGTKGQIVISKEIRDQLGIEPGWRGVQRVVDGKVEIRFVPPPHRNSLRGCLELAGGPSFPNEARLKAAAEGAWGEVLEEDRDWPSSTEGALP
jgi:AbrB family looped-hinge helix DNA binding protein